MTITKNWVFTEEEKKIVASILSKGREEQIKNEKFAIIDFDSFYNLFEDDEIVIFL